MVPPYFIVFEGIDGSGKSTQAMLLHRYLNSMKIPAMLLSEPTSGQWGRKIREMLAGESLPEPEAQHRLFMLDREDDAARNINPALSSGVSVVMDRYYFSNAAYQGAAGLPPAAIIADNRNRFPEPHRVYLIDIAPAAALERIAARNGDGGCELYERKPFLEKVRSIYLALRDDRFCVIDGAGGPDEVFLKVQEDMRIHFSIDHTSP